MVKTVWAGKRQKTIPEEIVDFLATARRGLKKAAIEDHVYYKRGTAGDITARRLRELVASGRVMKKWNSRGQTFHFCLPDFQDVK